VFDGAALQFGDGNAGLAPFQIGAGLAQDAVEVQNDGTPEVFVSSSIKG
jgi:hypothetical protein